ncbi:uncharacterized protein Z520_01964 [Fonsecaea multimorphosa CBS 102226]|uniref:Ricin B lectin domain-containing protein n=1 Tax=Fonsecaea multimorphosa CBS 102226 TaxID=1442371 RepID=A0A0D2HIU8_9EURO|nr:uncharacterized protein Z520_01964 [Fonsecaea multimorphosa CBS 102226]KIY01826.1 hypothetical protein Z520_01964 [Fonsecaea multimorphosa CBS 102226]OAL30016.1 hypothetical protein AYO22_01922 [Fonsecaea multimorphosa]
MTLNKVASTGTAPAAAALDPATATHLDLDQGHDGYCTSYTESTMTIMDRTPPATVSTYSDKGSNNDDEYDENNLEHDPSLSSENISRSTTTSTKVSQSSPLPPPPPSQRFLCPWPGSTYIIRTIPSGHILALHGGEVTVTGPCSPAAVGSSVHWTCEETKGWLGFRNVASGKLLGYDGRKGKGDRNRHGRLVCVAPRQQSWENFALRPRPEGGYLLLTTHFERLWRVGTRRFEQETGKSGRGDSGGNNSDEILAKIDDGDPSGEEIIWEFIKV